MQQPDKPFGNMPMTNQMIILALEDARLTNNDIYLTYIDFKDAFGSIDHAHLQALMEDLGYFKDAVKISRKHLHKLHHLLPKEPLWHNRTNSK